VVFAAAAHVKTLAARHRRACSNRSGARAGRRVDDGRGGGGRSVERRFGRRLACGGFGGLRAHEGARREAHSQAEDEGKSRFIDRRGSTAARRGVRTDFAVGPPGWKSAQPCSAVYSPLARPASPTPASSAPMLPLFAAIDAMPLWAWGAFFTSSSPRCSPSTSAFFNATPTWWA